MPRVRALNTNGEVTWCTAKVPGHGNCNHIFHQTEGISDKRFQQEVDEYNEKKWQNYLIVIFGLTG